jgi:eukaryotic-like serine/threonine-protein kinase
MNPMIKLQIGARIGSYKIQRFLARGGFAFTYLAEDKDGRKVCLKVGDVAGGGRYVTRGLEITSERSEDWLSPDETPAEAIFLSRTEHANIVRLRDWVEHEGRPVLVYDYIQGKTLREKIRGLEGIRLNWFLSIVRCLQKLKSEGRFLYHGDLKPENILVKPSGSVVMIDPALRGMQGVITTTPHYNPLLLQDTKADVTGIGVMLYEILTGTLPFDDVPWHYAGSEVGGEVERLSLSYFLSYPPPRELNPNTPEALERIVYKCLIVPEYDLKDLEEDLVNFLRKG